MIRTIRHRGPDETGVYLDNHIALGHARLSIIDLAGGQQPIANEDGSLRIIFNGEIFNYLELREDLCRKGHRFATRSDTEVILHLFEEYGESAVSYLNGQWAFAIWDVNRRRLFLSRDRFGVRPLFYTWLDGALLFASEIKALFAYPGVRRELDLKALAQTFTFWHTLPPRTAFQGVFELPPGCSATLDDGRFDVKRHWDISYPLEVPPRDGLLRERECAEELTALMEDACRLRLRSDVPVGAYLSGGLDSTFIAALVKKYAPDRLRTFSVRFDHDDLDEGCYQQEAARHLETDHTEIRCTTEDIGRVFPSVIRHTETPILRSAPAPLFLLSKLASASGFKVVLTGEGADELLGGYDLYKEVKARVFCAVNPGSAFRPAIFRRLYPYQPALQSQPATYLRAFFGVDRDDLSQPWSSHQPRWRITARLHNFFSAAVRSELENYEAESDLERILPGCFRQWDVFARAQYLETRHLLPGYILSSQGDRVAMAHSLEARFPFLDHRVAAFSAALHPHLKLRALTEKYLLKRCAEGLVPEMIIRRPKQPYRAPDAGSFIGPRAPEYVRDLLSPGTINRYGVFHPGAVSKLMEKAARGPLPAVSENMAVVGIVSTQLLIQQFIEGSSTEV